MKQLNFISENKKIKEHGGTQSIGKRKMQRPLSLKRPIHLVLKSNLAYGARSLTRHRPLIDKVIYKARKRFSVRVYEFAVVSNHIHLIVKGYSRKDLQSFFKVVAGHIAQEILRKCPLSAAEKCETGGAPKIKENKFWQCRLYTRIVTWGREFIAVKSYIVRNTLEALRLIEYRDRGRRRKFLKSTA